MTEYEQLRAALDKKLAADPALRAIVKRVQNGTATFKDTAEYAKVLSHILGRELSASVLDLSDRESIVSKLLHDCYNDINGVCSDVQLSIDEAMGLHLKPQKANYPAERVQQFSHSLIDPTVKDSVIKRRARAGSETITKSFHDDFIKKNVQFRTDAGLKCYIIRIGTKCCDWCTEVAGKYEMGDQPDGIFRRHDNCDCTIIYDGQVLRGKKSADGRRSRSWEEVPNADSSYNPTVLSPEEAERLQAKNQPKILTNRANGGKISVESELGKFKETISNDDRMSKEYYSAIKKKFSQGSDDAKALFNKYVNSNSVENASFFGTAHFDPTTKKISMSYYNDLRNPRGKGATWFHEHGHLIDDALNNISDSKEFRQCLSDDWLSYMKSYGKANNIKTFDKVQTAISKDLNSMRKHSAVSDLLEGVSNYGIKGCAGHRVGYWSDDAMICSEAFAHMYEAQFDKTRYAEMQKYFPSALNKFESMIKEAAK